MNGSCVLALRSSGESLPAAGDGGQPGLERVSASPIRRTIGRPGLLLQPRTAAEKEFLTLLESALEAGNIPTHVFSINCWEMQDFHRRRGSGSKATKG